jgi:Fe-S cluster biogenesis protein NfuA
LKEQVEQALEKIRPALMRDGGNVELVEVTDDGVVKVKLTGACGGCPMSQMTLKMGIEKVVKQAVPEVQSVEAVK